MEPPLEIGTCKFCTKIQTELGQGGYWIYHGGYTSWICHDCKKEKEIRSHPTACEWCNYDNVKWFQGNTYDCPRCKALGISH